MLTLFTPHIHSHRHSHVRCWTFDVSIPFPFSFLLGSILPNQRRHIQPSPSPAGAADVPFAVGVLHDFGGVGGNMADFVCDIPVKRAPAHKYVRAVVTAARS